MRLHELAATIIARWILFPVLHDFLLDFNASEEYSPKPVEGVARFIVNLLHLSERDEGEYAKIQAAFVRLIASSQ